MKKIIAFILCFAMLFSFAACGKANQEEENKEQYTEDPQYTEKEKEPENPNAVNPLTGIQDLDPAMKGHRIVGFSIGNTYDALPQSGPANCDLLLEIEVEYGITRLMAFYSDYNKAELVGSCRSLRSQFFWIAMGMDAMVVHAGCADYMYTMMANYGYFTLDGCACRDIDSLFRRQERLDAGYLLEHTAYSDPAHVKSSMENVFSYQTTESKLTDTVFNYAEDKKTVVPTTGSASEIKFAFSDWFDADVKYDAGTKKYTLYQHGQVRHDEKADKDFAFDNMFLIVAVKDGFIAGSSPYYWYNQGGTAYYFSNGAYQKCTWTKPTEYDFFTFYDENGKELEVNTGTNYMAVINQYEEGSIVIQ